MMWVGGGGGRGGGRSGGSEGGGGGGGGGRGVRGGVEVRRRSGLLGEEDRGREIVDDTGRVRIELSLEIAIDGTRKKFSADRFAASGKNGSSGVASAMLTMFPKFALVTEMGGEGDRRGFRRSS